MTRFLSACLLALLLSAPAAWAQTDDADAAFQSIYEKEWAWRQADSGRGGSEDDDPDPSTRRMPDVGPEAQARRLAMWEDVLGQLDAIDASQLSEQNQVNLAVYRPQLEALQPLDKTVVQRLPAAAAIVDATNHEPEVRQGHRGHLLIRRICHRGGGRKHQYRKQNCPADIHFPPRIGACQQTNRAN